MPTYDAEKCRELLALPRADQNDAVIDEAFDQLLAATQEVERLRKLVERCCAELHDTGGDFAQQVADELLGEADLTAIRHAAGGRGEGGVDGDLDRSR